MDREKRQIERLRKYNERRKAQAEQKIQKASNNFAKKAGVPKNATKDEANAIIIDYVSKMTGDFHKVYLSNDQRNDPKFLLDICKAQPEIIDLVEQIVSGGNLQSNVDFMTEFIKLAFNQKIKNSCLYEETNFLWTVSNYPEALTNPKLLENLVHEFPTFSISILRLIANDRSLAFRVDVKSAILDLPKDLLCEEAKKYGQSFVNCIPKDYKYFAEIVSAGIENDGFESLNELNIEQVLDNKDLVIKAYQKDGIKDLNYYIKRTLNPNRLVKTYTDDADANSGLCYDQRYEDVQTALLGDTKIHYIFKMEEKLAKDEEKIEEKLAKSKKQMEEKLNKDRKDFEDSLMQM